MCNASLALGASAAGGAYSTVGSYFAAQGQKTGLKAQAALADTNARISELAAQQAVRSGQVQEQSQRLKTANLKSGQRARLAANGVDLGSDSAVNILTTTDLMGEIDADTISANAARAAWGYRTQATEYQNDALMKRAAAKGINPWFSAGSTLLTSAASVGRDYYALKQAGAFSDTGGSELPWQSPGNVKPSWMGGGTY